MDGGAEPEAGVRFKVVLFYKYTSLDSKVESLRQEELAKKYKLTGRILVANEGVNGTVSAPVDITTNVSRLDQYIEEMKADERFKDVDWKMSLSAVEPFPDIVVKDCKEIISTGMYAIPAPDPATFPPGKHLQPLEFHDELLKAQDNPDYVVLDVRNHQEHMIGHFKGALDPKTRNFAEWPKYVERNINSFREKKVLMFCTGGIRCEKASAFLKSKGCTDVSQLKGGIHRYLETFEKGGMWEGKNFVFDKRVTQPTKTSTEPAAESPVEKVVGQCYECSKPWDKIDGGSVCTVCRDHVLVCEACRKNVCFGVYYCHNHMHLKNIYFYFVDHFSVAELLVQKKQLGDLHALLLKPPAVASKAEEGMSSEDKVKQPPEKHGRDRSEPRHKRRKKTINKEKRKNSSRKFRNQRRTLQRQIAKLDGRIAQLEKGVEEPSPHVQRCRTCMKPVDVCINGSCWGFWKDTEKKTNVPLIKEL
jgi:UPF0176 protein